MKGLSLTQPWATAVALGIKHNETRSWSTNYRGPLIIHAAKGFPRYAREFAETERAHGRLPERLPVGALIAMVLLVDVVRAETLIGRMSGLEHMYGDYSFGRYAWRFGDEVKVFPEPIPFRGALGLFDVPDSILPEGEVIGG